MNLSLALRMCRDVHPRVLWKFLVNGGLRVNRAMRLHRRRAQRGVVFPPFLFISVTNACNLACQGCWVSPTTPPRELPPDTLDRILRDGKRRGSFFYGILGGEPLLHRGLFDVLARHPDAWFLLFTNGTVLTEAHAAAMRRLGNVGPLISIEGDAQTSDVRRGGESVLSRSLDAIDLCRRHGLVIGAATSLCRSNVDDLAATPFALDLARRGVHFLWYYLYRPVGPRPCPELALSADQIRRVRQFLVESRSRLPLLLVDAYWDHEGRPLCPAVAGISHHINPNGDIEPCPPIQFALDHVDDSPDLFDTIAGSRFLADFRRVIGQTTDGCILLDNPEALSAFLRERGARDSSGRGTAAEELAAMSRLPDHAMPPPPIPETHPLYRLAKKRYLFGLGSYG